MQLFLNCLLALGTLGISNGAQVTSSQYSVVHGLPASQYYTSSHHAPGASKYSLFSSPSNIKQFSLAQPNPLLAHVHSPYGSGFPQPGSVTCGAAPVQCQKMPYRTLDGSCNNLENPALGIANSRYGRLLSPKYGDGIQSPTLSVTGNDLPNSRLVSLVVFGEEDVPDPNYTLVNMQWGQVMTHDMSMQAGGTQSRRHTTQCCTENGELIGKDVAHKTCYPIIVPPHDPAHSQTGTQCMEFVRTLTDKDAGCPGSEQGPAEQLTTVTSYLDLSLAYGNSIQQNSGIRAFQGGRMIVEERNGNEWLPRSQNATTDCDAQEPNEICYLAGDIRVNQNPGLTILHTVLIREHNRIADGLSKLNPHWSDKKLFQEARKINIGQYQHISYYEWLPIFLGAENMIKNRLIYQSHDSNFVNDYDPSIDPSVINSHATAAFRYFHSQIEGRLDLISEMRTILGSLRLSDWLNRPSILEVGDNYDSLTRGLATQPEELTDINFDREIKHFLFKRNMPFGGDLRAIDIQRNRDHGLASYNDFREFCGVGRAHSWEGFMDLISPETIENMKKLYVSHEDVDVTVGGSVERHVTGALAGPTFLCILTEQFYRTRVGDRYFFENANKLTGFTRGQLAELRKASVSRLLCDNGNNVQSIQPRGFITVSKSNPILPCSHIPEVDLTQWLEDPFHNPALSEPGFYAQFHTK